jgi:hypothetical protein
MSALQSLYPMVFAGVNAGSGVRLDAVLDASFGLLPLAMAVVVVAVAVYDGAVTTDADGRGRV